MVLAELARKLRRFGSADRGYDAKESADTGEWDRARLAVLNKLWGHGHVLPGGDEFTLELVRPLTLTGDVNLLDLNAGMGGQNRMLARQYGIWIDGRERDNVLVEHGMQAAYATMMEFQAPVAVYDPNDFHLRRNFYEAAVLRDILYSISSKEALLRKVSDALTRQGEILICDFLHDQQTSNDPLHAWRNEDQTRIEPWGLSTYEETCDKLRLKIRMTDDYSERYVSRVRQAFNDLLANLDIMHLSALERRALADVTIRSASRLDALRSGTVWYARIFAVKNDDDI